MSDRVRVALILAAVALVAGGGGFYFFKIYRPAQDLKNAQQEITTWETRFAAARDCLLGKTPGSAKTSEALAIREMAPDPWDRGRCTPLISKLSRGEAPDTGIPEIEKAWSELDKSASKAALAFAKHVSESTTLREDPLPDALDELDAARGKLRAIAKMKAAESSAKALPAAQIVPLADGSDPVTSLEIDTIPSAGGIILFGRTANRTVQMTLVAGAAPKANRVGPGSIRSTPDTSWGATPGTGEVRVGTFDDEGAMPSPTSLKFSDQPTIAAVGGTLADGIVIYGGFNELVIARAKAGAVTTEPPIKITSARAAYDVDGRVAALWTTPESTHHARIFKPGSPDEPILELPRDSSITACMTKDRVWTSRGTTALAFGGGMPVTTPEIDYSTLQGCTADVAIFRNARTDQVFVCSDACRKVQLPSGAPAYSALTAVGGKLVAIASHAGVLGVWREGAPPVFYSLPEMAKPVLAHEWPAMAMTDGKVIDVIARGTKTFVVIRIPAA